MSARYWNAKSINGAVELKCSESQSRHFKLDTTDALKWFIDTTQVALFEDWAQSLLWTHEN